MLRQLPLTLGIACVLVPAAAHAGPPYVTDDPEPVECLHWGFYLATQNEFTPDGATGGAAGRGQLWCGAHSCASGH